MTLYEQIFFVISMSSTIILVIQTILALIGMAGDSETELGDGNVATADGGVEIGDTDSDIDVGGGDHDFSIHDADNTSSHSHAQQFNAQGLRLFTVRGIMAFLMVGSWVGFLLSRAGVNEIIATICAFASGMISLVFMAKIMQMLMGLQSDGTTKVKNALCLFFGANGSELFNENQIAI